MALPFLKKKEERSLGVDIGTSSIKIVELTKRDSEKIELTNYGEFFADYESTIHSSSVRLSAKKSSDIIRQIMKEARMEARDMAMSIPVFSGFSTVITLPKMSDAELERAVIYEAKKYVPLPLSEVQFEWVKLNPSGASRQEGEARPKGAGGQARNIDILIVAVTSELINRYHEIAKLSGLNLLYLELDTFSLARSLAKTETYAGGRILPDKGTDVSSTATLIIDIGSRNTILSIIENGWPIFTRTVEVSGYEFSRLLGSALGVDFSRAEAMKKEKGVDAGAEVILPLLDSIFLEGRRLIEEYANKNKISINKVILSGGSARMRGIAKYAARTIGREAVLGFPFDGMIYPRELDATLRDIGPSFSVATGLALREFQ